MYQHVTLILRPDNPDGVGVHSFTQVHLVLQDETELTHVIQCLRGERDGNTMDVEAFQRLLVTARSVAITRPNNLVKFADQSCEERSLEKTSNQEGKMGCFRLLGAVEE